MLSINSSRRLCGVDGGVRDDVLLTTSGLTVGMLLLIEVSAGREL